MKKIDTYIALTFWGPFLLCLGGLVGLFAVIDFIANIDEFLRPTFVETTRLAAVYYLLHTPWYLVQIMPMLTALPAVICLLRLQGSNELCAIRAAGVSVRRSAVPIIACSVLVMVFAGLNQEFLVPALREPLDRAERAARDGGKTHVGLSHAIDRAGRFILIDSYDEETPLPTLSDIEITWDHTQTGWSRVVTARRAFAPNRGDWDLWFLQGPEMTGDGVTRRDQPPRRFRSEAVAELIDGYRSGRTGALLTADQTDDARRAFRFGEYTEGGTPESFWPVARGIEVIDPADPEAGRLVVDRMVWVGDRWLMFGAVRIGGLDLDARAIVHEELAPGTPFPGSLRPADIWSGEFRRASAMMTLADLAQWAATFPSPRFQQRCWVTIWNRIAYPFANIVLVLLALPLVFRQDTRSPLTGVALAALITMAYIGTNIVSVDLAYRQTPIWRWPPFAGLFPTILFGIIGLYLFRNMDRV